MRAFDEAAFLGEGIGIQPFEQVGGIRGDHLHLREMHMGVDQAGQDQVRAVIDHDRPFGRGGIDGGKVAHGDDLAVLDQQRAVAVNQVQVQRGRQIVRRLAVILRRRAFLAGAQQVLDRIGQLAPQPPGPAHIGHADHPPVRQPPVVVRGRDVRRQPLARGRSGHAPPLPKKPHPLPGRPGRTQPAWGKGCGRLLERRP